MGADHHHSALTSLRRQIGCIRLLPFRDPRRGDAHHACCESHRHYTATLRNPLHSDVQKLSLQNTCSQQSNSSSLLSVQTTPLGHSAATVSIGHRAVASNGSFEVASMLAVVSTTREDEKSIFPHGVHRSNIAHRVGGTMSCPRSPTRRAHWAFTGHPHTSRVSFMLNSVWQDPGAVSSFVIAKNAVRAAGGPGTHCSSEVKSCTAFDSSILGS